MWHGVGWRGVVRRSVKWHGVFGEEELKLWDGCHSLQQVSERRDKASRENLFRQYHFIFKIPFIITSGDKSIIRSLN